MCYITGYKRKVAASCLPSEFPSGVGMNKFKGRSCLCCYLLLFQLTVETFAVTSRLRVAENTMGNATEKENTACNKELGGAYMQKKMKLSTGS